MHLWDPLRRELDAWSAASAPARLWLRDDDAVAVTPALCRLVELTEACTAPILLAVIPAAAEPQLAEFLAQYAHADVGVHGFAHTNHAGRGAKAQELTAERSADHVLRELRSGRERLYSLFGARCLPLFVPPWNRISHAAALALPRAGYRGLSTFGWGRVLEAETGLTEVNTHVDIIDWRGARGGRDPAWLAGELAEQLARAREARHVPVGVLTHHLVHDETAWHFLESLFAETAKHANVQWVNVRTLMA